jgi:peptide/nickel transport system substrate-binding protein
MRNVRYIFRLIAAFFVKFRAIIIIGTVAGVGIFFLLGLFFSNFSGRSVRRIGIVGRYSAEKLPNEILNMVGDGLTQIDEKGDVAPNLSSSWETPDKGKTWIFKLDPNKTWQDNKKLTSADINYQFQDLDTEKPDNSTLVYKLKDAYSAFPSVVSKPIFKKGLLGTDSWEVKKISIFGNYVQQITLENNKREKIIYKFYPTEERLKLAFKLGEVHELKGLLDPKPLDSWKRLQITSISDKGKYVAVFFNTQNSAVSDKTFRQSLAYAIDKDALGGERALSPISADSWSYNPQVKPYTFDLEKAKTDIKSGTEITLTTSPLLLPIAEKISKNWQEAGVKVNIEVQTSVPSDFQALLAIFDAPEDPDQYSVWHSTQTSTNVTKYSNPRIDKLLEDGRTEINLEERKKIYLDFQRFLVEDSPAIFLYYPTTYTITR